MADNVEPFQLRKYEKSKDLIIQRKNLNQIKLDAIDFEKMMAADEPAIYRS